MSIYKPRKKAHARSMFMSGYNTMVSGSRDVFRYQGRSLPYWIIELMLKEGNCYINHSYDVDLLGYFGIKFVINKSQDTGFILKKVGFSERVYNTNQAKIKNAKNGEFDGLLFTKSFNH